jgi:uncharacterized membrane protein (DUF441 family)
MEETRRPSRQVALIIVAIGVVVALASGLAETVGIGGGTFGWKQAVGVGVGAAVALVGVFLAVTAPGGAEPT